MILKRRVAESILWVEKPIALTRFGSRNGGSWLAQLYVDSIGSDFWNRGVGSRMVVVGNRDVEI